MEIKKPWTIAALTSPSPKSGNLPSERVKTSQKETSDTLISHHSLVLFLGTSILKFMNTYSRRKRQEPSTKRFWIPISFSPSARGKERRTIKGGKEENKITSLQMEKQRTKSRERKRRTRRRSERNTWRLGNSRPGSVTRLICVYPSALGCSWELCSWS